VRNHRQGIERRRNPRLPVRRYATIAFHGHSLPCNLVDESSGGVRLADFPIQSCPVEFVLLIGEGEPRSCRVPWRSQVAAGVQFLEDEQMTDEGVSVRTLNIAHYERLLLAGAGAEMAAIYRAEIAAARAMIDELLSDGNAASDEDNAST
jgi:PilZ domain-containing protein